MGIHIVFDGSSNGIYFPGNTVVGRVICSFKDGKSIRGVRVKLRGREHTQWIKSESYYDSHSKRTRHRTVHYSGDNKFLQSMITLVGESTTSVGQHEYPFSFLLPPTVPGSYCNPHGSISFYIKALIDVPYGFDKEDVKYFTVAAPIDLNEICDLVMNPVVLQDEKQLCCCCCGSGPILMDVHLDKPAFVIGEAIRMKVEITNMADRNVSELKAKLQMTTKSKATYPRCDHKCDTELIAAYRDSGVGANGPRTYNIDLQIPRETPLPNFKNCALFSQWCVLEVEAVIKGCHRNLAISTGITLGYIALRRFENLQNLPQPIFYPVAPPDPTTYSQMPPAYSTSDTGAAYSASSSSYPMTHGSDVAGVHGAALGSFANAPPQEDAPSAPSKKEMAENRGFEFDGDGGNRHGNASAASSAGNHQPAPPSYNDVLKETSSLPRK